MDIWEANSISTAVTPHPCGSVTSQASCNSPTQCGSGDGNRYTGTCDRDGCDYNTYRLGNDSFFGPKGTVDSNTPVTVVTQFVTSDNTPTGDLTEIRRIYVQNGKVIDQGTTNVAGIPAGNSITSDFCSAEKKAFGDTDSFGNKGGLQAMGKAMDNGMVLVMSLWDDYAVNMLWLDSDYPTNVPATNPGVARGTCPTDSGVPATVEGQSPNSQVVFSNIKFGSIGSTYSH